MLSLLLIVACALHPDRIPDHTLFADDGERLTATNEALNLVVVGNLRPPLPLLDRGKDRAVSEGTASRLTAELKKLADRREMDAVVLLGDLVRWSSDREWGAFDGRFMDVFDGATLPTGEGYRVRTLPVAGDREHTFDAKLEGLAGAWPAVGADIGYGRVASWYAFDLKFEGRTWRLLALDTDRRALGSRWDEQLRWLEEQVSGRYDHLVVFMHLPRITLAPGAEMNEGGVPAELLETLEDGAKLDSLRVVFAAGPHTSELYLPDGRDGAAYVVAGGGGAPAMALERWGDGTPAGYEALQLEARFDAVVLDQLKRRAEAEGWPDAVVDQATGSGEWEGFPGQFDAQYLPLYGYWTLSLDGDGMSLGWVHMDATSFTPRLSARWTPEEGWVVK